MKKRATRGPRPLDVLACPLDGISLIEASAGTGKTWNICGLVLRLLLERGLELRQILIVTFTNAATAELRERVRARIVETLGFLRDRPCGQDDFPERLVNSVRRKSRRTRDELATLLESALGCFDEAAIYTIHGFCQRALADTPLAAGLPYGLELREDDTDLRHQAVADFWRRRVAGEQSDPLLAAYLEQCRDSPERWAQLLKRLQAKPLAKLIWPEGLDALEATPGKGLAEAFERAREQWASQGAAASGAILKEVDGSLDKRSYSEKGVRAGARAWDLWFASGDPLSGEIAAKGKIALFRAGTLVSRTKKGGTTPRHPFFDTAEALHAAREQTEEQLALLRLRLLRELEREAGARLREQKRARRVVAFDDILHNAWTALHDRERSWLAPAVRERYPVALIDEFQDTDPLQCAVFLAIYGVPDGAGRLGPLFLVGDPKQAIYSFRNADLHTYLRAKRRAETLHTLATNQRSVDGLIRACNALFEANGRAFVLPGIDFQGATLGEKPRPEFADRSERGGPGAPLRIWRLPRRNDQYLLRPEAQQLAVQATAAEIARLLREAGKKRLTLDGEPLRAADIAVLVRSHAQGRLIKRALAALGIGSVELSQESVFSAPDAEELERVLLGILEPSRQAPLLAALATELMGLDAPGLDALRRDETQLPMRMDRFRGYRDAWRERGFGFMFRQWMDGEQVSARLLAREDGERRLTNLLHLGELLQRAAAAQPAPESLVRWLATQRSEAAAGDEAQLRLESDRNLVQIVTIHKSKGLQYGIVFCPFLWSVQARARSDGEGLAYHDDDSASVIDFRPQAREDKALKLRRRIETAAEDIRASYVALTRAVHRCYLVAGCFASTNSRGEPKPDQSTRSLLNWLAAGGDIAFEQWIGHSLGPNAIESAWQAIAERASPHVLLGDIPTEPGEALAVAMDAPEALNALPAPRQVPRGWRIGSFTGLAHGAAHEVAASDHDARAPSSIESGPPENLPAEDILRFPRGPSAGDCFHAAFEHADFTEAATWDRAIERALELHPQRMRVAGDARPHELQRATLRGLLDDVLSTEIADGIVLGNVAKHRRLNELGFNMGAGRLDPFPLNDWLKRHQYALPRQSSAALQGYLRGFIDLVFEHGGRYYLLDWKSNHLGYAREDYAQPRLEAAMQEHGYHLQHLLYTVALHRFLGQRIAGYDYKQHFGGVLYLFTRGVRPDWRDADGKPLGVWFHRAPQAVIASLDALLDYRETA